MDQIFIGLLIFRSVTLSPFFGQVRSFLKMIKSLPAIAILSLFERESHFIQSARKNGFTV